MAAEYLKMGWVAPLQPPSSSSLTPMYHELITSRPSGHAEATALTRCVPFKGSYNGVGKMSVVNVGVSLHLRIATPECSSVVPREGAGS